MPWIHPIEGGAVLGDGFGCMCPIHRADPHGHNGIDLKHCAGRTVVAPFDCVVIGETTADGLDADHTHVPNGNSLIVEGVTEPYRAAFLHMDHKLAHKGQRLRAHEPLGVVGNTGKSYGPHSHLSMTDLHWQYLDPAKLFAEHGVDLTAAPSTP